MEARRRWVARWLVVASWLVVAMVALGGLTRLTRSGLSIVEWAPVRGVLPPLSEAAWQQAFAAYRESPEGRLVNAGLELAGFQRIFLVEWFHRLFGRLVGVAFALPLAAFAWRGWITRRQALRYLGWFALGGLQGLVGWLMVRSGLQARPHVSPYWLTAHLLTALAVFVALRWEALALGAPRSRGAEGRGGPVWAFAALVVVTLAWGGLMAGHKAGWVSATFPKMAGEWIPSAQLGGLGIAAAWANPFAVHFVHRVLGLAVVTAALALVLSRGRGRGPVARASRLVLALALVQAALGVWTVLWSVPIALAVAHQVNGALLLGATVTLVYRQGWGAGAAGTAGTAGTASVGAGVGEGREEFAG